MYKGRSIVALVPAYNEEGKIGQVVQRARLADVGIDNLVVIDDASTDATAKVARSRGAHVITHERRCGVGAALRTGMQYARREGFEIAVIMAGNNKDEPGEIPRLLDPICDDDFDMVIGSRHRDGGVAGGSMPVYRRLATRMHPWLMSLFAGKRLTESTNGFRAFRLSLLDDRRIRLDQPWLDGYGLEVYLLFKAIRLGYRHTEVPCTKIYPPRKLGYTKMKPIIGWWSIMRPIFLLGLGLKH
jgi:dolichol-phosphate mannosyltransferase